MCLQGITIEWSVPRAGIEPARIAPLVFETNASTNSAIWASFDCRKKCWNSSLVCSRNLKFGCKGTNKS